MGISDTDRASHMTEKLQRRVVPHVAPSLNFKRNVILVSDEKEYEPEHILQKMRNHKLNHLSYDPTFYKKTKMMLAGLL